MPIPPSENSRRHRLLTAGDVDNGNHRRPRDHRFADRRRFLGASAAGVALTVLPPAVRIALATELVPTPRQSLGPFYPLTLPLDSDNDLVSIRDKQGVATGVVTELVGRVSDQRGRPLAGARIEIWQCNAFGRYHHPRDRRDAPLDEFFQGYGRFTTDAEGSYRFRTIKPVPYPGRTPHVHFAVSAPDIETLVTQMYVTGEPRNRRDGLLNSVRDARARQSLIVDLEPSPQAPGELVGRFDLVLVADGRYGPAAAQQLEPYRRRV